MYSRFVFLLHALGGVMALQTGFSHSNNVPNGRECMTLKENAHSGKAIGVHKDAENNWVVEATTTNFYYTGNAEEWEIEEITDNCDDLCGYKLKNILEDKYLKMTTAGVATLSDTFDSTSGKIHMIRKKNDKLQLFAYDADKWFTLDTDGILKGTDTATTFVIGHCKSTVISDGHVSAKST